MDQKGLPTESRSLLQLVLDTVPARVFWKDRDSVYLGCNRLFATDAGLSSVDEVVGKTDYDMPWREQADKFRADDHEVVETGNPKLDYEEPLTTADGRKIWLQVSKVPVRDEKKRITGVMAAYMDITERRNAEEEVRERESLYRTMFEQSPFSVALTSMSGEFVDVNKKFEQIVGVPRDEAIGHTPAELGIMDHDTQTAILEAIRKTGGKLDGYELLARTRAGDTRHALISSAVVKLKEEPLILSILNDITDFRRAEEALRASEEKYRDLVQSVNSVILRWGRDGTIYFLNEFGQNFFGFAEEELAGRNVVGTIVPQTETSGRDLEAMIAEITAHPEFHRTNVNENMRKNGERVWIAWTNKPVFNPKGDMIEILSVGLDITERIRDQQALQESEARYRSIFNSNVDAFLLLDPDGRIVDANTRAAELYGCSRGELIDLHARDIVDPASYIVFEDFARIALGEWFSREAVGVKRDGTRYDIEVHGTRLRHGTQEQLLAIVFDVTERNKAREAMRLYASVVENMLDGLYIYRLEDPSDDHTLRLMAANPATRAQLGLSGGESVGKYIDEIFPGLREHGIPQRFADVVRTCMPFSMPDFAYHDAGQAHRHYSFRAFPLPGNQMGVLFEDITQAIHAEEDKRQFYRRTIAAATEGKLIVCDREEIERMVGPAIATFEITSGEELGAIRQAVGDLARAKGMEESRVFDLVLCVGEATTNAIKHAHGGTATLHDAPDGLLFVVSDHGPGIEAVALPEVALTRGYTTAVSLGMGYKEMICLADKVYLSTGSEGTTVAVEMEFHPVPRPLAELALPDTW